MKIITTQLLKAHIHPRCISRPVLQKKKTFRVVENHCLQWVMYLESIFVNLPQFAKSGLKESLNRLFGYFSLHLFGYFGLVSSLFVYVVLEDRGDGDRRSTFPGGKTPHMKGVRMLVVLLRGVNFGFLSHLGCSGQNAIIFSREAVSYTHLTLPTSDLV